MVLIDSPGHGRSDALRRIIDLKDSADVLVDVLDALDIDRTVLIGNSWGGMLAGVFPAYYPERTIATAAMNATASLPTTAESVWATTMATVLSLDSSMPSFVYKAAMGAFAGPTARAERPEFLQFLHFPLRDVRRMADAIPGSRFEVLQHTGHLAARENPEAVNAVIDSFLAAVLPAAG